MRYGSVYRQIAGCLLLTTLSRPVLSGPDPMQPATLHAASNTTEQVIDSSRWRLNLIRQTRE